MAKRLPELPVIEGFMPVHAQLAHGTREALDEFSDLVPPGFGEVIDRVVTSLGTDQYRAHERAFRDGSHAGYAALALTETVRARDFPIVPADSLMDMCGERRLVEAASAFHDHTERDTAVRLLSKQSKASLNHHPEMRLTLAHLERHFNGRNTITRLGLTLPIGLLDAAWPKAVQDYYNQKFTDFTSKNP